MTPQGKKALLTISLLTVAGTTGYIFYIRKRNEKNSFLLLEYISTLPKMNTQKAVNDTLNKVTETAINKVDTISGKDMVKGGKIIFNGKDYTKDGKGAVASATEIAKELNAAMSTKNPFHSGTDLKRFETAFKKIGSKNAMIIVNTIYNATYGETLWKAIQGELQLYTGNPLAQASLTNMFSALPNYHPIISKHLITIK